MRVHSYCLCLLGADVLPGKMDPGFTFLWHQLDSSRRHRKGCSALAAQRKGWPLREVDRKKKMELESFIEKATIELDLSAYAILIRYK